MSQAMDEPLLLTVPEAAKLLRISRGMAYELASQWLETDGDLGIPAVRFGRRVLIHRVKLLAWIEESTGGYLQSDE